MFTTLKKSGVDGIELLLPTFTTATDEDLKVFYREDCSMRRAFNFGKVKSFEEFVNDYRRTDLNPILVNSPSLGER